MKNQSTGFSDNNATFKPEINEKSKKMKRSGSVGDILYEDALQREVKMQEKK